MVRDLDLAGLRMPHHMAEDARFHRYDPAYRPQVIDLGLWMADASRIITLRSTRDGLEHVIDEMTDESTDKVDEETLLTLGVIDPEERALLLGKKRIELDALTNDEYVDDFVCRALDEHSVRRVMLRGEKLDRVFRRASRVVTMREACRRLLQRADGVDLPPNLEDMVEREMAAHPEISCDAAAFRVAERLARPDKRKNRAG